MPNIVKFILQGPLCGRWYATPVFDDGSKGGVTGFDSFASMEAHTARFPAAALVYMGPHAASCRVSRYGARANLPA
ncbi:hypothetical protein [Cupriavidus taiwanensis]|uniref:Uncharacterized protein n=2 Tax=Cupriavidus taiwanensis TaxID=164546 RepID=B3R929_CUPTR|nr:hypothetical protein [Cupriavidus taiwanensis]CAQ71404.1 hypothetical protein RALTA_B0788 [Cupriavidus taiwanensis LMG 19424]SOY73347.1 hypothetical protein CBM2585_B80024 [Cupriavidus taiwanensis]SOZ10157.1 hypothetical protein CBM2597_B50114 [Cupriavidus taiwanensis]SOZ12326.1 hypothetical protein CBM2595_B50208 [Cupriavidus taiwanensis]SOZ43631.1 hypothetical protein CBM2598_B40208 [Cupriavidus taiwanensis]